MEFKDSQAESKWAEGVKKNQDDYGAEIYRYAQAWAELMEVKLAYGEALESIAKQMSHDADTDGITGFMYGAAVSILSCGWKYGEALRRWHNLDTQIEDEGEKANKSGGTLNPALLNVGQRLHPVPQSCADRGGGERPAGPERRRFRAAFGIAGGLRCGRTHWVCGPETRVRAGAKRCGHSAPKQGAGVESGQPVRMSSPHEEAGR